jgi:hypothetical protein
MVLGIKSGHDSKGLYITIYRHDDFGRTLESYFTMDCDGILPTSYSEQDRIHILGTDEVL